MCAWMHGVMNFSPRCRNVMGVVLIEVQVETTWLISI